MDGASLAVLGAAQTLTSPSVPAAGPTAAAEPREGFAAILRATDLTGLSADQQAALTQLLGASSATLPRVVDAVGKELPQAAIRGLLGALGIALDQRAPAARAAVAPLGVPANAQPGVEPDPGADLAAIVLAMIPQEVAGTNVLGSDPERDGSDSRSAEGTGGLALEPAQAFLGILPATPTAAAKAQAPTDGGSLTAPDVPSATIRQAGSPLHGADSAQPRAAPPAGNAGAGPERGDSSLPTAFLGAVESVAREAGAAAPPIADLARDLVTALDAASAGAGRSGLAAAQVVPPTMARAVDDAVSVPVGERGWGRAFGERVLWLVGQQVQAAEVKLNPPHLGPVEVRLSLTGQDATVNFTVTHGATRDAIEQAIPRLRELFAQQQLQIVNVDVGQRDASSHASHGDRGGQGGTLSAGSDAPALAPVAEPSVAVRRSALPGIVDEYV